MNKFNKIWTHPYFNTGCLFAIISTLLLLISNLIPVSESAFIETTMIIAYTFTFNAMIYILSAIINSFTKKPKNVHIIGLLTDLIAFIIILLRLFLYKPVAGEELLSVEYSIVTYVAMIICILTLLYHITMLIVKKIKLKGR